MNDDAGCTYIIIKACIFMAIGRYASDVFFWRWFDKDLPFIADVVIGSLTLPVMVTGDILGWAISFAQDTPEPILHWLLN